MSTIMAFFVYGYIVPGLLTGILGFMLGKKDGLSWALSAFTLGLIPIVNVGTAAFFMCAAIDVGMEWMHKRIKKA